MPSSSARSSASVVVLFGIVCCGTGCSVWTDLCLRIRNPSSERPSQELSNPPAANQAWQVAQLKLIPSSESAAHPSHPVYQAVDGFLGQVRTIKSMRASKLLRRGALEDPQLAQGELSELGRSFMARGDDG